ncbi:hypothetical protein [Lentzea sp. NPDC059081]|uniref:hypothetical protein n=1 Tax=Lentzea sp. NPDC059081 TaxID=3346719 RepID=UPI00369ABF86
MSAALLTIRIAGTEVHVVSASASGIDLAESLGLIRRLAAPPYDAPSCEKADDLVAHLEPRAAKLVVR